MVPVFKDNRERCMTKNYLPVSLLSGVSKVLEKLINERVVDYFKRCDLLPDFQ